MRSFRSCIVSSSRLVSTHDCLFGIRHCIWPKKSSVWYNLILYILFFSVGIDGSEGHYPEKQALITGEQQLIQRRGNQQCYTLRSDISWQLSKPFGIENNICSIDSSLSIVKQQKNTKTLHTISPHIKHFVADLFIKPFPLFTPVMHQKIFGKKTGHWNLHHAPAMHVLIHTKQI